MRTIILASSSPRRKQLLESIGITFKIIPSNIEEKMNPRLGPAAQAELLSVQKAEAVARLHQGKELLIIAADTIVIIDGEKLGKPESDDDAKRMLRKLSGKKHSVVTGFTILDLVSGKKITSSVQTQLWMRTLSAKEILSYVQKEMLIDKAGSYAIQGIGAVLFEQIEGDYTNVLGLPIPALYKELKKFGVHIL